MRINGQTFGQFKVHGKGEPIDGKTGWLAKCLKCGDEEVHVTTYELQNHEDYICPYCTRPKVWTIRVCIRGNVYLAGTEVDIKKNGVASYIRRHPEAIT